MPFEAADEAAQVVLVKLLKNMREFEYNPQQSFRAWLNRVTRNSVVDGMRRLRPDQGVGGSDVIERLHNISDSTEHQDLADSLSMELRQTLFDECERDVRQRVNEQTWEAFSRLRSGQKASDVGTELGMSVGSIYRAKTRVLQMFREEVTLRLNSKDE